MSDLESIKTARWTEYCLLRRRSYGYWRGVSGKAEQGCPYADIYYFGNPFFLKKNLVINPCFEAEKEEEICCIYWQARPSLRSLGSDGRLPRRVFCRGTAGPQIIFGLRGKQRDKLLFDKRLVKISDNLLTRARAACRLHIIVCRLLSLLLLLIIIVFFFFFRFWLVCCTLAPKIFLMIYHVVGGI